MILPTVTPAGGVSVSTVGMSAGSRGLFAWTCSSFGSVTFRLSATAEPGRTVLLSTVGASSARTRRSCASPAIEAVTAIDALAAAVNRG